MDDYIDQLLAEMSTTELLRVVVQNITDEPISEEVKERLLKPLLPQSYQPNEERKMKNILEEYDPIPPQKGKR